MRQQQQIPLLIQSLSKEGSISQTRLGRGLMVIIKCLHQYTTNPQSLPPSENFIPFCLFKLPEKLCQLLNIGDNQLLFEKPEKTGIRIMTALYLKSMSKLVVDCQQEIKHIVVQGMTKSILIAAAYPPILKRWLKLLLELWCSNNENLEIALRCHMAISKYLTASQDNNLIMWTLRRAYVSYFEGSKQVSMRNYEHINFMINSFCELVKINKQRSYYVLFGYLRSIALQLDKLHKSKRKLKVQLTSKLFSNQILSCIKLFVGVVSRVEGQELTALIYPLCEVMAAYQRITESPEFIPLKLHLLQYELTIMESTSIYIPHSFELVQKLLKSAVFHRKLSKKSEKSEANLQIAYKISKTQLSEALLINELFNKLITKIYWFATLLEKNVYGVQVLMKLWKVLKSIEFSFSQYRHAIVKLTKLIKADFQLLYQKRAESKMSIQQSKKHSKFEKQLSQPLNLGLSIPIEHEKLQKDQQQLLRNKLAAEQQQKEQEQGDKAQDYEKEDEDEVNSGWEEASEGASEMDIREVQDDDDEEGSEEKEEISYEGDPEDADELVKQWDQEEWSSQGEVGQN